MEYTDHVRKAEGERLEGEKEPARGRGWTQGGQQRAQEPSIMVQISKRHCDPPVHKLQSCPKEESSDLMWWCVPAPPPALGTQMQKDRAGSQLPLFCLSPSSLTLPSSPPLSAPPPPSLPSFLSPSLSPSVSHSSSRFLLGSPSWPHTIQNFLKWIRNVSRRAKTTELIEGNMGESFLAVALE